MRQFVYVDTNGKETVKLTSFVCKRISRLQSFPVAPQLENVALQSSSVPPQLGMSFRH